ncbi:Glutamate carboxypeptidase, partial [Globisporangium splendens]
MVPFASTKKKTVPVLATTAADAETDAYGTFDAATGLYTRAKPPSKTKGRVLRALGIAGVVLLAASYVSGRSPLSLLLGDAVDDVIIAKSKFNLDSILSEDEQHFVDGINKTKLREHLHFYASAPHSAGTKRDYDTAVYTAKQFESYGINATIKEYYTLLSTPIRRRLSIVAPKRHKREIDLSEAVVKGDECTSSSDALPPFLAYAANGNVTASVVYANFGRQEDFQFLADQNVTLKGKIALVRYGGNFRGLKVMAAEFHQVAGVLIYSDPQDDGFVQGSTYPKGPWRPEGSFQRGSLQYLSIAGGDPLTPGFPSNLDAPYLKYEDVNSIPHIPALPLSYGQAQHILKSLGGAKAPDAWQGGLKIKHGYHLGSDEATVLNLELEIDNKVGPIWDVIGTIEGAEEPDQQVLIGNHRDAWVCGAVDPNSGSAVLLEIGRNLGELLKAGWKPRRTLVLGSWDGEEYGLLGSTEYAEDNAETLKKEAVAYINVDSSLGPLVSAGGTPSIAEFLYQTAKAIPANRFYGNETEVTLYEQWSKQAAERRLRLEGNDGTLGPEHLITLLGSGTDYTAFYQHLGIISANLAFSLSDHPYGVYHSTMDSIPYYEKFADPNYETQTTTARWWGLLAIRLASKPVIPFDFSTYAFVMTEDLAVFETKLAALNRTVDFTTLHGAIKQFSAQANLFHAIVEAFKNDQEGTDEMRKALNTKLVSLERYLLTDDGLPHRPWYKHVIFGPGFYEGYRGAAFPGIDDAIAFSDNSSTIQAHVDEVARVVQRAADYLASE